jgi:hypothetical protein
MLNGGQDMLDELYKENQLPKDRQIQSCEITLGIDTSVVQKT